MRSVDQSADRGEVCGIPGPVSSLLIPGEKLELSGGCFCAALASQGQRELGLSPFGPDFPRLQSPSQPPQGSFTCCGFSRLRRALATAISTPNGFDK